MLFVKLFVLWQVRDKVGHKKIHSFITAITTRLRIQPFNIRSVLRLCFFCSYSSYSSMLVHCWNEMTKRVRQRKKSLREKRELSCTMKLSEIKKTEYWVFLSVALMMKLKYLSPTWWHCSITRTKTIISLFSPTDIDWYRVRALRMRRKMNTCNKEKKRECTKKWVIYEWM